MPPSRFHAPTRLYLAPGCSADAPSLLREQGFTRALIVTDGAVSTTPWFESLIQGFESGGITASLFDETEANPTWRTARTIGDDAVRGGAEVIVGLGGGSSLDAAKAGAMLATNVGDASDFEGANRFSSPPLSFMALPTTCGTGSEVTWVSVLSHEGRKVSIKGDAMYPRWSLVDPELLTTLPVPVAAATAMDAITHAIEATTCLRANAISDVLAEASLQRLFRGLAQVETLKDDAQTRWLLAEGATLAGLAFGSSDVAAVHCLSESLGGRLDLPHGLTNAHLLEPVLRYSLDAIAPRLDDLAKLLISERARHDDLLNELARLRNGLPLPPLDISLTSGDVRAVARLAESNGSNESNAHPMNAMDYEGLLREIFGVANQ